VCFFIPSAFHNAHAKLYFLIENVEYIEWKLMSCLFSVSHFCADEAVLAGTELHERRHRGERHVAHEYSRYPHCVSLRNVP